MLSNQLILASLYLFQITWYRDSKLLPASNRYTVDYDLYTGIVTLKINEGLMSDVGTYLALAENEVGADQTSGTVFLKETPNIDNTPMVNPEAFRYLEHPTSERNPPKEDSELKYPPKVIVPLSNVKLEEGQSVLLACKIEGQPRPKVWRWKELISTCFD